MSISPEEAEFLKAIAANPADETARLALADWLQEEGNDARAAFARLSADFLRCLRGFAEARAELPPDWLGAMDPLLHRLDVLRVLDLQEGIEYGTVTVLHVSPGSFVALDQPLIALETDKATLEVRSDFVGFVTSVLVEPGERVTVGAPLLWYRAFPVTIPPLAPSPPPPVAPPEPPMTQLWRRTFPGIIPPFPPSSPQLPAVPREPLAAFVHKLKEHREALRGSPPDRVYRYVAHLTAAAELVFGEHPFAAARLSARSKASPFVLRAGWENEVRGETDEQHSQKQLDVLVDAFHLLLEWHGTPACPTGASRTPAGDALE